MIFGEGAVGVAIFFLWIYCVVDSITADNTLVRNLPKVAWVLIVIFFPLVGSILWLALGRPAHASFVPGSSERRPTRAPRGPEDAPDFARRAEEMRLKQWQEDLKRREEELRRREEGEGHQP